MGIDPVTHKPKNEALPSSVDGQYKSAAKLSHMAQWESARLEAEARLVRESKLLRSHSFSQGCSSSASGFSPASTFMAPGQILGSKISGDNLESPTSILTFSESIPPVMSAANTAENPKKQTIEFVGSSDQQGGGNIIKEEGHYQTIEFVLMQQEAEGLGFTELLLDSSGEQSLSEGGNGGAGDSDNGGENGGRTDHHEDNKNYWNSILNLVNSSPAGSPLF
ncbi:hypothetical protein SAY86_004109 [Trapa natans]|uniref:Uncharacterized protein n=1 Tax=Trapa natans TaxID=22666 RepID=A0AAN7MUP2_TRANT|nr:hypothetical protein SAY86_004109 [Trapa natans]